MLQYRNIRNIAPLLYGEYSASRSTDKCRAFTFYLYFYLLNDSVYSYCCLHLSCVFTAALDAVKLYQPRALKNNILNSIDVDFTNSYVLLQDVTSLFAING